MQKDDIILKKGDIIHYKDGGVDIVWRSRDRLCGNMIIGEVDIIERPIIRFEEIYKNPKSILDKKEYLGNLKLSDILLFENYIIVYKDKNGVKHTYHIEKKFSGRRADKFWKKGIFGDGCKIIKIVDNTGIVLYEKNYNILDRTEKEYLKNVLRPFKDKIKCIVKSVCFEDEFIYIVFNDSDDVFEFPLFKKDTMYEGMEVRKEYTLEELGLFKE